MKYSWQKNLIHGIEPMDSEHKLIIDQMDELQKAIKNHSSDDIILETMKFLTKYVEDHFKSEERLQKQYNYTDIENHKKLHEGYKALVYKTVDEIKEDGLSPSRKIVINKMIIEWLKEHIGKDDKLVAEHIKSKKWFLKGVILLGETIPLW